MIREEKYDSMGGPTENGKDKISHSHKLPLNQYEQDLRT